MVKTMGFTGEQKWVSIQTLPLIGCLGLIKLLNHPKSQFVHLQYEANKNMHLALANVAWLIEAMSSTLKGHGFNSYLGHITGCGFDPWSGWGRREAVTCFASSPFLSL